MSESLIDKLRSTSGPRFPLITQGEAAECGLACIAMIASFFGHKLDIHAMRRDYAASLRGTTLKDIMEVANRLGLITRALRVDEIENLCCLQLPAILHWNLNHFVVLRAIRRRRAIIHDPAIGIRHVPLEQMSDHFTGVALELRPSPGFTRRDDREVLRLGQFFGHVVGLKRYLVQVAAIALVAQVLAILSPLYIQVVVDETIVRRDTSFLDLLAFGFLTVITVQSVCGWIRSSSINYLGNVLSLQLQASVIRHLLRLPMNFFLKRHVGDITSRISSASPLQSFATTGLVGGVVNAFTFLLAMAALLIYDSALFVVPATVLTVYAGLRAIRLRALRLSTVENLTALAESGTQLLETIRSITTVKVFGLEVDRLSRWQNCFVEATNSFIRVGRISIGFAILHEAIGAVGLILVVYFGSRMIMDQAFSIGMLMAFLAYQTQFVSSGAGLIDLWNSYKLLSVPMDRLSDIALATPEEEAVQGILSGPETDSTLQLRNVSFRYGAWDRYVLEGVSLSILPGECIAIVGPSGVGKSTLIRIMLGLLRPETGLVAFGGTDIGLLGLSRYRRMVAAVTQDDRLFSGSLAENITMFAAKPDMEWMVECAKHCLIHDAVMAMPMKYHSLVGDMGDVLSAGERQRVMLARALYRRPRILFLDEATSNLDVELDRRLNEMLARLKISRVIATHRSTPLRHADRVYQLASGKLEVVGAAHGSLDVRSSGGQKVGAEIA